MDRSAIRVINKNQFGVALSTRDRNIYLEGTLVNGVPVEEYFTLAELEFINNRTPVVRDGIIEFDESEREEVYAALKIPRWKETCIFEDEIDDMLINGTIEKMEKIVAIVNPVQIDRIFSHMQRLIKRGQVDISTRVQKVVEERRKEILRGDVNSRLRLRPVGNPSGDPALEKQVSEMVAEQVARQLELMRNVSEANTKENAPEAPKDAGANEEKTTTSRKAGRPASRATGKRTAAKKS